MQANQDARSEHLPTALIRLLGGRRRRRCRQQLLQSGVPWLSRGRFRIGGRRGRHRAGADPGRQRARRAIPRPARESARAQISHHLGSVGLAVRILVRGGLDDCDRSGACPVATPRSADDGFELSMPDRLFMDADADAPRSKAGGRGAIPDLCRLHRLLVEPCIVG
jgi:hypothetical protein